MTFTQLSSQLVKGGTFLVCRIIIDDIGSFFIEEDRWVCLLLEAHGNYTGPVLAHKAYLIIVVKNPFSILLHLFLFDLMCLQSDPIKNKPAQEAYLEVDSSKEGKVMAVLFTYETS